MDKAWLNDNVIKFVLKCLNYVKYNETSKNDVPSILFGSPLDKNPVVIEKAKSKVITDHVKYNENSDLAFYESEKQCVDAMKCWYSMESKNYMSYLLDEYSQRRKSQMISRYANVMNVNTNHWILLVGSLDSNVKEFEPNVYTIDNYYDGDDDAFNIRRWYAKFFGLYVKQHKILISLRMKILIVMT